MDSRNSYDRLTTRLRHLKLLEDTGFREANNTAMRLWEEGHKPVDVLLRRAFCRRGTASTHDPLPKSERPPCTRLISPRGIALKFYLTAAFAAQTSTRPAKPWTNDIPITPLPDRGVSWERLSAVPIQRSSQTNPWTTIRQRRNRQIKSALAALEATNLIQRRDATAKRNIYDGFSLLCDSGESTSISPIKYTVPDPSVSATVRLPHEFFTHGWVHVLTDSEIAALLMWFDLDQHTSPNQWSMFANADIREGRYGLSRDAYETHAVLEQFKLIKVHRPKGRMLNGRFAGHASNASESPPCHRISLTKGFDVDVLTTVKTALEQLRERITGMPAA